jgi:hypothetical protein
LLSGRQQSEQAERFLGLVLVVEALVGVVPEVRHGLSRRKPPERRGVASLRAALMADDVAGDPVEPREHLVRGQILLPSSPRL